MKNETKLIEKQKELIDFLKAFVIDWDVNSSEWHKYKLLKIEIAALEKEPTAMEMIKEVFEPIQLPENEVVNQALELASKKAGEEKENIMLENMQYYMEYCRTEGYITPEDWIKFHKHF